MERVPEFRNNVPRELITSVRKTARENFQIKGDLLESSVCILWGFYSSWAGGDDSAEEMLGQLSENGSKAADEYNKLMYSQPSEDEYTFMRDKVDAELRKIYKGIAAQIILRYLQKK